MSETTSLLLATTVLALGGLGLYLFKTNDSKQDDSYDEDKLFNYNEDNDKPNNEFYDDYNDYNDYDDYEKKPRNRGGKTKRIKKGTGTKRKY
jgi:hypothetical protein